MNDERLSNHQPLISRLLDLLSIFAVAVGMIYCNGGIGIGSSNHVGLLPVVRRILDPNYLPGDFNIALRFYHHRAFAYLVAGGSSLLGEDRALAVLGVLAMLAVSAALFGLCSQLGLSRIGFLVVGAFVATRFFWTGKGLEANEFLGDPEVMPPHLAHTLVLLVLTALLKEKYRLAMFLTGLAILLHLQIGVTLALMTSCLYIIQLRKFGWKETALLLVLAVIPASPALWHVAQMLQQGLASSSISSAYYIDFRHPHHFELSSAAAAFWVAGHLAIIGFGYFFFRQRENHTSKALGKLLLCCLSLVALCLIHFADYYLVKNDKLAQVQFLRLTPLVTILGAICFVLVVSRWLKTQTLAVSVKVALIVAAAIWGWHSPRRAEVPYYFGVKRFADEPSNWVGAALWVKANGPRDTVYVVPPGRNGFSVLSERSIVAEFKLNPDGSMFLAEWFERLRDLSGGELPTGRGFENRRPLDKAFAKLTNEQLLALSQKYNARYAVLHKDSKAQFEAVYQNKDYRVVRLQ
ncbi:MAG: DUF6798 domain-containing protein [Acidobacteriota bacterium]|nr:DUF6798 domain-containing protein [Acidobacteriota bacterium]